MSELRGCVSFLVSSVWQPKGNKGNRNEKKGKQLFGHTWPPAIYCSKGPLFTKMIKKRDTGGSHASLITAYMTAREAEKHLMLRSYSVCLGPYSILPCLSKSPITQVNQSDAPRFIPWVIRLEINRSITQPLQCWGMSVRRWWSTLLELSID